MDTDNQLTVLEQISEVVLKLLGLEERVSENLKHEPVLGFGIGFMILSIVSWPLLALAESVLPLPLIAWWSPVVFLIVGALLAIPVIVRNEQATGGRRERPPAVMPMAGVSTSVVLESFFMGALVGAGIGFAVTLVYAISSQKWHWSLMLGALLGSGCGKLAHLIQAGREHGPFGPGATLFDVERASSDSGLTFMVVGLIFGTVVGGWLGGAF